MKTLTTILIVLTFTLISKDELYCQNHGIAYSIKPNQNRVHPGSKPFRAYGTVIVSHSGKISSNITISSNHFLLGFTGGIKITFYDKNETAIYEVISRCYGVNRESSRIVPWSTTIPEWAVHYSQSASVEPIRNSTNRTIKTALVNAQKYGEAYLKTKLGT